ncbi:hypothetical protein ACN38_g1719 [Penicillium nordicum]|uniref:Uncharacterized protein n=1 Tax=Penicillium nordicum TaxID=229535 RepID=A0A0M8PB83_9EURO|nr:hypothetical protein ACN38_g1719 [Penicillium nordicum]
MALKENNKAYVRIVNEENTRPTRPDYLDTSTTVVRELALLRAPNPDRVTEAVVRELVKERQHDNARLRAEYRKEVDKWEQCNTRVCNLIMSTLEPIPASYITHIENAREAFQVLKAEYGSPSWQTNYKRFEYLSNLQYKWNNPWEFVRKYKETIFDITQRGPKFDNRAILNHFIKATCCEVT